ncbi:MAG TPA: YfhO family protein [Thermoanaerobaculia bacterium]|jgi:hypothetical protein
MAAHRFAFALIAVVAVVLFAGPLLRGEVPMLRDHADYFQPLRWFTAVELREGRLPLWNPYNQSGEPWLANPQTGVFYPPQWLFLALPFPIAYVLYLLFHVALLGWGAYLLFARSVSRGAAMVGAVALMLSGPALSLLDVSNNLATFAWIPLVLWCAATRRPIVAGIVLALAFLAGEPFFAALAAVMYCVVVVGSSEFLGEDEPSEELRGTPRNPRNFKPVVIAAAIAFGLSAIQLLPFLELILASDRLSGDLTAQDILHHSMPLRDWLRIVVPPRLDASMFDPHLGQHFILIVYVGIVPALLAIVGIATAFRRRLVHGWLALLLFAVVIATGPLSLTKLPVALFRYPARLVPFAAIAIAALAALGWERIRPKPRWGDLLVVLIILADLTIRTAPLLRSAPFDTKVVPYEASVGRDAKVLRVGQPSNAAGRWWMIGYSNLFERRWDVFTPAPLVDARYYAAYRELLRTPRPRFLAFLPVEHIISDREIPPPIRRISTGPGVALYRTPSALPLATFWSRAHTAPSPEEALRALLDGAPVDGLLVTPGADQRLAAQPAEIHSAALEISTSHAKVRVNAPREGIVVVAQRDAPGWRVTVDGKASEKLLANGIFRAVAVPAGVHEVVWTYRPPVLVAGTAMTAVTLFLLLVRVFVKRRGNRKSFSVSLESE